MFIQVVRTSFTSESTESKVFVNGTELFSALEDKDRFLEDGVDEKVYGETAIPRGTYTVHLTYSNRFKTILPELLNVPYFTGIRIHSGNKAEDSEGCLLIGKKNSQLGDNWIEDSRNSLHKLTKLMREATSRDEEITIEIV